VLFRTRALKTVQPLSFHERRLEMALKQGEVYRCPDPECGCEITVSKGAALGKGGNQNPRCYCGKEMVRL
jgi:hypothetical protein